MKPYPKLLPPCRIPPSTEGERFRLPSGQESSCAARIDRRFNPLNASSATPASLSFHWPPPESDVRHPPLDQNPIQTP